MFAKDCTARVEEHEVRLGVARSKTETQAAKTSTSTETLCFLHWEKMGIFEKTSKAPPSMTLEIFVEKT